MQTPDRYILALHRIIHKDLAPGRPVVFLQHGILCSSADWVMGHRDKAFGRCYHIVTMIILIFKSKLLQPYHIQGGGLRVVVLAPRL